MGMTWWRKFHSGPFADGLQLLFTIVSYETTVPRLTVGMVIINGKHCHHDLFERQQTFPKLCSQVSWRTVPLNHFSRGTEQQIFVPRVTTDREVFRYIDRRPSRPANEIVVWGVVS